MQMISFRLAADSIKGLPNTEIKHNMHNVESFTTQSGFTELSTVCCKLATDTNLNKAVKQV